MTSLLARRLLLALPTMLGLATVVFFFLSLIPGDPVDAMLGENAAQADREQLRRSLGLDLPIPVRYARYVSGLARGDLGSSINFSRGTPVARLIGERLPWTVLLAATSVAVALLIAIPLGAVAALRPGSWLDLSVMVFGLLGISMPGFWVGAMLLLVFSFRLDLFPTPIEGGALSIVLPALTLGFALAGILTRMTRAALLDVIRSDFVRTARAKGLPTHRVILHHALRNALLPVVTIAGLQLGALLTGAVVTEQVFTWKGLGLLTLQGIQNRDYPLVQGCVLVISVGYLIVNLLVDVLYSLLDPRIQLG